MTKDELLLRRFRPIFNVEGLHYPNSPFTDSIIQEVNRPITSNGRIYPQSIHTNFEYVDKNGSNRRCSTKELTDYPNLFRELQWYEERKVEDMPKYVLFTKSEKKEVWEVQRWDYTEVYKTMEFKLVGSDMRNFCDETCVVPATEEEYKEYKRKTNEQS